MSCVGETTPAAGGLYSRQKQKSPENEKGGPGDRLSNLIRSALLGGLQLEALLDHVGGRHRVFA